MFIYKSIDTLYKLLISNVFMTILQNFLMKKQANALSANGTVPGSPYRNW